MTDAICCNLQCGGERELFAERLFDSSEIRKLRSKRRTPFDTCRVVCGDDRLKYAKKIRPDSCVIYNHFQLRSFTLIMHYLLPLLITGLFIEIVLFRSRSRRSPYFSMFIGPSSFELRIPLNPQVSVAAVLRITTGR